MDKKLYEFANVSNETIQQIRSLEKTLSEQEKEEVILIAYENNQHN